jgi:hypothetical protein
VRLIKFRLVFFKFCESWVTRARGRDHCGQPVRISQKLQLVLRYSVASSIWVYWIRSPTWSLYVLVRKEVVGLTSAGRPISNQHTKYLICMIFGDDLGWGNKVRKGSSLGLGVFGISFEVRGYVEPFFSYIWRR